MDTQKNLLPTLCHLCGMKATRNIQRFKYDAVMRRLHTMFLLADMGGGTGYSPLHIAADLPIGQKYRGTVLTDVRHGLVDGMFLSVNFVINSTNILVLPRTKGADEIARLWAYIVHYAKTKDAAPDPAERYAYVLVNPTRIEPDQTRIAAIDISTDDADICKSTYEAFVTAAVTDDETDFDIERELQGVRSRSNASRERIKRRMHKMGLRMLKGTKASIYLRRTTKKCTVDLKKLETAYPAAYRDCVTGGKQYEYITIRLHEPENKP